MIIPVAATLWRGGRVAEGDGLLNRYRGKLLSWVRIPSSPPFSFFHINPLKFYSGSKPLVLACPGSVLYPHKIAAIRRYPDLCVG